MSYWGGESVEHDSRNNGMEEACGTMGERGGRRSRINCLLDLASRTKFDIIFHTIGNFEGAVLPNQLEVDMTELIQKYRIDLSGIEPTILEAVKQASGGKLYGLPVL